MNRLIVLAIFLGDSYALAAEGTPPTPNMITVSQGKIEISMRSQIWTSDHRVSPTDLQQLGAKWEKSAASSWNNQNFSVNGKTVHFDFQFIPVADESNLSQDYHHIEVNQEGAAPDGSYATVVVQGENPLGPHQGRFATELPDLDLAVAMGAFENLAWESTAVSEKSDIPASIQLNGQTLYPTSVRPVYNVWAVGYGLQGENLGVMSGLTSEIKEYYLSYILSTLGYPVVRNSP